jgi:hypothetical protein
LFLITTFPRIIVKGVGGVQNQILLKEKQSAVGCRTMKAWGRGKRVFYSKVNDNNKKYV